MPMEDKYYKELTGLLEPFCTAVGLKAQDNGIFLKDGFAAKIDYDDEKKLVLLKAGKPKEGEALEFITLSQYLFDETHSSRDLKPIAIDFEESLRTELGQKKKTTAGKVAMPTRNAVGETPTIEAFTKGFLDIFPHYRDTYRALMAQRGSFYYVDFYKKYGVEKMKELVAGGKGTEKNLTKYINYLGKMYTDGDKYVAAVITTVIIGGSFYNDRATFEQKILPKMEALPYFKQAAINSVNYAAKNKAIQAVFTN